MSILTVIRYPDLRLRHIAKPVTVFDDELKQFVANMFETMYHDAGIGLAAAQVADQRQLFVMDISAYKSSARCFINPEITHTEGEDIQEEGCLSFPSVYAKVRRAEKIHLKAYDEKGTPFELHAEGLEARCIQHELDHLKGKIFIDYLSPLKRSMVEKKYKKLHSLA